VSASRSDAPGDLAQLARVARRVTLVRIVGMAVFAALALTIAGLVAIAPFDTPPPLWQRLVIPALMLYGAVAVARLVPEQRRATEAALRQLTQRPAEVVWIYVVLSNRGDRIVLGRVDGQRLPLPVTRGRADALLAGVARHAPHAALGYSPQIEDAFTRDPGSVRRTAS
jgi:hypothetical protein